MATILFELFPAQSHHLMAFKMAHMLKESGHRVIFGSVPEMQELVLQHGFEFQLVPPWVVSLREQKLLLKKKGASMLDQKEQMEEVRKAMESFNQQASSINPALVLLDHHAMVSKVMSYKKLGIKVAFISPMPGPEEAPNVPPFSSGLIPRKN
jgi:UDP:flavonoid glycosyltransferase YjiC (YdhE family)